ncbi:hypothetical protein [Myxosarcina sp. GI1(2024)]
MEQQQWVGIDVCQKYLDVYICPIGKLFQVTNDDSGISELVKILIEIKPELIVLEATGQLAKTDAIDAKILAHF